MKKALKRLVWLVLLAGGVLAGLYVLGSRTAHYRAHVDIAAVPERVYAHLVEPDSIRQWVDGVVSLKLIGEARGVGTLAHMVVEDEGRQYSMTNEVLALDTNRIFSVRIVSEVFVATNTFQLEVISNATRVHQTMHTDYIGIPMRVFAPIFKTLAEQQMEADLQRLKVLAEAD